MTQDHKAWYSRGYHPHFDSQDIIQMIGFRLADSLPTAVLRSLEQELKLRPDAERLEQIESALNAGYGSCHLKDPRIAAIVENALQFFDGKRHRLHAWVVMPTHVHVLYESFAQHPVAKVVQSWKGFTAREANKILGRTGDFWQRDYFDRYIRNERHYCDAIDYIHMNPVKAGLAGRPKDWPWSSARLKNAG